MKHLFVRQIKPGDQIQDYFLVIDKNISFSQKGSPYLSIRLRDKTGEIDGRMWDRALEYDPLFKKGDIVRIRSRAASFRNSIQLSITDVCRIEENEIDPADFSPSSRRDIEEMFSDLMAFVSKIENPPIRNLLSAFFTDGEIARKFKLAPAAKGFHHVCIGGLLEHTLSVVRLLEKSADHFQGIDRDLLIAGGILHDIGKIDEMSAEKMIEYTDEGRLIGHVVMGIEMLDRKIAGIPDFPPQTALMLRHILLSHHGEMEFGSPKRPKTLEALIIHFMDDLDAKVNAFQNHIELSEDTGSDWAPFHRLLERFIYKKRG